jgi:hypothetical protein
VYLNMVEQVKAGNAAGALANFFGHAQAKYDEIFTALGAKLPLYGAQVGNIVLVTTGEEFAEIVVERGTGANKELFKINLMRGEDGVWRIESM